MVVFAKAFVCTFVNTNVTCKLRQKLMFKRLFNKNHSDGLSKNEYWNKWELHELFDDLDKVEQILKDVKNTDNNNDLINFKDIFIEEFYEIKGDNVLLGKPFVFNKDNIEQFNF